MIASRCVGLRLAACFVFLLLSAGSALADGVPAATDCWATDPGTMAAIPPLGVDFFGPGSLPFGPALIAVTGAPLTAPELTSCACPPAPQTAVTWVDIHGNPVPASSVHKVSQVPLAAPIPDTCIKRLSAANFPGGIGVPQTVPIELVQLSLVSVNPIAVPWNVGPPRLFDVTIKETGIQVQGAMELTPAVVGPLPSGSAIVPSLPIAVQFSFIPQGPGSTALLNGNVNMQNPNPQAPGPPGNFAVLYASPPVPVFPSAGMIGLAAVALMLGFLALRRRRLAGDSTT